MSTFTLAISCLTTSNLPWFMDLTFQVPMQYCSLQHRTLLLSPVTSTTGYWFCFGSIPSFFLELFPHWSPVAIGPLVTWGVPLSVSYHFAFSYCSWGSQGKNTEVVCHSLLQWSMEWSRTKVNRVLPRECISHSKQPLPKREDSTHGHHQRVKTEIRLIIFFAVEDGKTLYS